ncbi:hypothetical protein LUD75_13745 [Epilithonimonas sp. JDS]|uniref:hypothetical protein n=1 Tax=Epilithonimonas sp. JDS TaxID=2902797 RepID=UPI001E41DDB1|nr:hypothetical protein [Epilithonimonas sp. JDS]MCD9855782.1 hypothetical protein [Epilithonimonas sp. JDS]
MRKIIKEERIGNGNHWHVFKVLVSENEEVREVIHKRSADPSAAPKIIEIYKSLSQSAMETLAFLDLYDKSTLETEDLNANPDEGYFVSPNTVRSAPHCGSISMRMINKENVTYRVLELCKDFDLASLIEDPSKIDREKMYKIKLIDSIAEQFVYDHEIEKIENFEDFVKEMLNNLMSAAKANLALFVDAFFFKVNPVTNMMDY